MSQFRELEHTQIAFEMDGRYFLKICRKAESNTYMYIA